MRYIVPVFFFYLCLAQSPPPTVNIGLFGDKFGVNGLPDVAGNQIIASMLMAVKEINNKSDKAYDNLLPSTKIQFALRETRESYLLASSAALDLATTAFNTSGVVGSVGAGSLLTSRAAALMFSSTPNHVNIVDYSTSSTLAHAVNFPYYSRVSPADSYDGVILARVIKNVFNWKTVNVFSTLDSYGIDTSTEFLNEAANLGITVENQYSFWPGTKSFQSGITATMKNGTLKVFVLLMNASDAGALLEAGYNAGLFKIGTQIVGTKYVSTPATWFAMSANATFENILNGYIGIIPQINRKTSSFQSFLKRYLGQRNTKIVSNSGGITCSLEMDDEMLTYLYVDAPVTPATASTCAGIVFSSLSPDGSDLSDNVAYAYDAVVLLASAIDALFSKGKYSFTGDDLNLAILNLPPVNGISGSIGISSGNGGTEGFGKGNRNTGLQYRIVNFNPVFFYPQSANPSFVFRTVGVWNNDLMTFTKCSQRNDVQCSQTIYNTLDGKSLSDRPTVIQVQMSDSTRSYLKAIGIICLIVTIFFFLFLLYYFDDSLIVPKGQPPAGVLILIGCALGSIYIILLSVDITDQICIGNKWLAHMSVFIVLIAIVGKAWSISNATRSATSKVHVNNSVIWKAMSVTFAIFLILLAVDTAISQPHQTHDLSFDGHHEIWRVRCGNKTATVSILLYVIEASLIAFGAKLCWDTKLQPPPTDSSQLLLAVVSIGLVTAIIFPMSVIAMQPTPENLTIANGTGFFVALFLILNVLFLERILGTLGCTTSFLGAARSLTDRAGKGMVNKRIYARSSPPNHYSCASPNPSVKIPSAGGFSHAEFSPAVETNRNAKSPAKSDNHDSKSNVVPTPAPTSAPAPENAVDTKQFGFGPNVVPTPAADNQGDANQSDAAHTTPNANANAEVHPFDEKSDDVTDLKLSSEVKPKE